MWHWLAPLAIALFLGACATQMSDEAARSPDPEASQQRERSSRQPGMSAAARRALAKHGIKPHDTSPLTVRSRCFREDEIGTATQLDLSVNDGSVGDFRANVLIKGRGRCRFALADFHQESRLPHVLLRHAGDAKCTVRMWREQTEKITIAFNGCHKSCEGNAFEYLWPILVESETGQCF